MIDERAAAASSVTLPARERLIARSSSNDDLDDAPDTVELEHLTRLATIEQPHRATDAGRRRPSAPSGAGSGQCPDADRCA